MNSCPYQFGETIIFLQNNQSTLKTGQTLQKKICMQLTDHFVKKEYLQYTQFLINNIYVNTFFSGQGFGITQNSTDAKNTLFNINKRASVYFTEFPM